jgi:glycosyltransferase involved in cell wall biosynthesis
MEDGVHGLLCDPKEPESIAEKVVRCLKDEDLRARLGKQARIRVERHFSAEVMVPKNLEFYRRVAGLD